MDHWKLGVWEEERMGGGRDDGPAVVGQEFEAEVSDTQHLEGEAQSARVHSYLISYRLIMS
jgi:hypothetical protein